MAVFGWGHLFYVSRMPVDVRNVVETALIRYLQGRLRLLA